MPGALAFWVALDVNRQNFHATDNIAVLQSDMSALLWEIELLLVLVHLLLLSSELFFVLLLASW